MCPRQWWQADPTHWQLADGTGRDLHRATRGGGRVALELKLLTRGILAIRSSPNHPQTCGKIERFQQTMKKWLAAQPDQPSTIAALQALIDRFVAETTNGDPIAPWGTEPPPASVYISRPKATPGDRSDGTHDRVRRDRVDKAGKITLRHGGRLYSIGLGRAHTRTRVIVLVQALQIRIVDATTGELLRELTLDPTKR